MSQANKLNKKMYFFLLVTSILTIIAVLPYAFALQADILKLSPLPLPLLALISIIQSTILFAIAIYLGLKLSKSIGLGLPILEYYLDNGKLPSGSKSTLSISVLYGLAVGVMIVILDYIFKLFDTGISLQVNQTPALWQNLLATSYGGISEEIMLRLFFMSLIVWIIGKIIRNKTDITKNNFVMWFSIIFAAIVFGLGHLPITSSLTALTPIVILRAIILNGVGGIIFGWLFWKKGLENAIIAHFSADMILLVIFPITIYFF